MWAFGPGRDRLTPPADAGIGADGRRRHRAARTRGDGRHPPSPRAAHRGCATPATGHARWMWTRSRSPDHDEDRAAQLGQAGPGVEGPRLVTGTVGVQGDPVHVEGEVPERPLHPSLGGVRAVEPESDLPEIEGVEGAGGIGRLEGRPRWRPRPGRSSASSTPGRPRRRGHQDQCRDPVGMGQRRSRGRSAPPRELPTSTTRSRPERVEHGHQVLHLVVGLGPVGGRAEAARS